MKAIGKSYTTEILKAAIAQTTLKDTQIETILSANGLQNELLKTTTNELANVVVTNMVAKEQQKTTGTTLGLGTAFKGLWISIEKTALAMAKFLFTTPAGWATLVVSAIGIVGLAIKKHTDDAKKAIEEARERTSELYDEFKKMNNTLADHKKTVAELADRYDELSKGVDLSSNENISLSTDDYEEFLDINKQLADSFPALKNGVDENGNSILSLGTKGITAKKQLEELLKTEEDLNRFRIASGLEEAFKGVNTYVDEADKASNKLNSVVNYYDEIISGLQETAENIDLSTSGQPVDGGMPIFKGNSINEKYYMQALNDSVNEFFESLDKERYDELYHLGIAPSTLFTQVHDIYGFEVYSQAFQLTLEEQEELEGIIQDNLSTAIMILSESFDEESQELQNVVEQGKNSWTDFVPNLVAGMKSKQTFKNLDHDLQDIAIKIVEGLDYSYATAMAEYNPDPYFYIRDKLIVPMSKLKDSDKQLLADSYNNLLTIDANDLSNSNREEITKHINTISNILGEDFDSLELRVAFGFDSGDDAKKRLQNSIIRLTSDMTDHDEYAYLMGEIDFDNFTLQQAEIWLKATQGAENAKQAVEMYKAELDKAAKADNQPLSISETVDQLKTKIKPAFDSLESAWKDIFTENGFALNSIDILSTCDSIKSKLDELNKIDGITVDYSSYEDFVRVLRNSESTEKEVQDAFDALATSITQVGLSGKEDFQTMKAALEDLGVVNNEIVAFDALINNTGALKGAGLDLVNATEEDITDFVNKMMISAENAAQAVDMLTFQKELFNLQEMNSGREVEHLRKLAENAGYTGDAIQYLTELELIYSRVARGYYGTEGPLLDEKLERAKHLTQLITESSFKVEFDVEKESADSAGKDAAKSFTDALDKELSALDKKMEAGYIDFNDYIQARLTLIEAYYRQGRISADEYYSYLEKHYETQLSYMDKVVGAVTRRIDTEIDALKQQKEDVESLYKVQIESLEKQKTLLEEANQERQRQIDLQRALYDLERARNQRTKLIYSEDKGMHYVADDQSIRDARKKTDNAKYNNQIAEIAKSISKLEEARNQETNVLDEMISSLEEYKDAWSDITSAYKEEQEDLIAAQMLGANWENDILNGKNGRLDVLNAFKNKYINIQQAMVDAAWRSANEQVKAAKEAEKGSSGSTYEPPKVDDKKDNPPQSKISNSGVGGGNSHANSKANLLQNTLVLASRRKNLLQNTLAYGSGTNNAKKGLNLVGEDGAEAYFDNHGHVAIVTKPTLIPMEGGEVVKNERDTKELLDLENLAPADTIGLADIDEKEARYTIKVDVEAKTFTLSDGTVLTPLQPEGRMFELQQKFDAYMDRIAHNVDMLSADIAREQSRQMQEITNPVTNSSTVNNRNVQPVVNQNITLNCPNVTNNSGIEYIRKELGHLSLRAMQESMK